MCRRGRCTRAGARIAAACAIALTVAGVLAGGAAFAAEPAPTLSNVAQSASVWHEGSSLAVFSDASAAPIGTTFSFTINERAQVTFTFVPSYSGRRICHVHVDSSGSTVRTCTRVVAQATLSFIAHRGTNHVRFFGRVSTIAKPLAPAGYRLTISARNHAGASAQPAVLNFTIVR
jgi:hypothetical protein